MVAICPHHVTLVEIFSDNFQVLIQKNPLEQSGGFFAFSLNIIGFRTTWSHSLSSTPFSDFLSFTALVYPVRQWSIADGGHMSSPCDARRDSQRQFSGTYLELPFTTPIGNIPIGKKCPKSEWSSTAFPSNRPHVPPDYWPLIHLSPENRKTPISQLGSGRASFSGLEIHSLFQHEMSLWFLIFCPKLLDENHHEHTAYQNA